MTSNPQPILRIDLPEGPERAKAARDAIRQHTGELRAVDRFDLAVIAGELAAWAGTDAPARLRLERTAEGYLVEVEVPGCEGRIDPLAAGLLDDLAEDWTVEDGSARASIAVAEPLPGEEDDDALFARLRAGDPGALARLTDRHRHRAVRIARRFSATGIAVEDLEQVAMLGLLGALDRFDPDRGVRFSTFAARTIEGEIKRHLRDSGWAIKVPRGLQDLGREAVTAQEEFAQEEGRVPTLEETADLVDADLEEVARALLARRSFTAASLNAPVGEPGSPRPLDRLAGRERLLPLAPAMADVAAAMEHLDERDRTILYLRFFEDLSQREIAEVVGISQMHVSRLLARSLPRLRRLIEESSPPG